MKIPFQQAKQIQLQLTGIIFNNFLKFGMIMKNGYENTAKFETLACPN